MRKPRLTNVQKAIIINRKVAQDVRTGARSMKTAIKVWRSRYWGNAKQP